MDSPMPVTTLFPTLTLLAHQLSPTPCPLSPMLITQVFMVILMPTVAFTATPDVRSVMPRPPLRPPLRLIPRPRLPLKPGTDTTDVPAIMEDMAATTDTANRPNQLHPRPTHPIINQTRPTT